MSGDGIEGVAAGLPAMEAEFLEIDENGRWNAVYQVGSLPGSGSDGEGHQILKRSQVDLLI